jgi:UDP-3-O-[3-hydroxymyristoyl] glucosamine N-acyltransferase
MESDFLIGIGNNSIRENFFRMVSSKGKNVHALIHTFSSVSRLSEFGTGVFVNRNVSINALAKIGNNVLLNSGCIIEHECVIVMSNNSHIAPGAV